LFSENDEEPGIFSRETKDRVKVSIWRKPRFHNAESFIIITKMNKNE
jgi:hypothetical protein